ncbi:hypothetical protein TKK_0004097 [Trichogramma kaykai]
MFAILIYLELKTQRQFILKKNLIIIRQKTDTGINHMLADGNPVTGAGYELHQNGTSNGGMSSAASSSAGSEKSSTDSSPSIGREPVQRLKNRVPPGGFSSGLW